MSIPIGHIDDSPSMEVVLAALRAIHGPDYGFAVGRWDGETQWQATAGRATHRFVVRAEGAHVQLQPGHFVRGPASSGPYRPLDASLAAVTAPVVEELWPGDAICLESRGARTVTVDGCGVYFEVSVVLTGYLAPTVVFLRHLDDRPGGCAAYPGAFRREALPPLRSPAGVADQRGANRVNEHTLDMRLDRTPPPIRHYHGPVPVAEGGAFVNHSETAIVLPRAVYGLPEVGAADPGHVMVYRRPAEEPSDTFIVPVQAGSVIVTPATTDGVAGHCFENAFAMLIAIPGFVAPYHFIHAEHPAHGSQPMRPARRVLPAEERTYTDRLSGVTVRQLTHYKGHSHHLYFTNPGWYDGGRRLLFGSDRANRHNLFSVELATGEITQLTDLDPVAAPDETDFMFSCVNPVRGEAYCWHRRQLMKIDLDSLEMEPLWEMPPKFMGNILNCTADGKYVCTGIFEDLSDRFAVDYMHGYVGFHETWEARPISRILRVATDGSGAETVWEERSWIGHVNTSPTQPHLLTFCHEGPWHLVDNRIWGLDLNSGRAWQVRPRHRDEIVGHEYWHADGVTIGYHGRWPDGEKFFGCIRYDNADRFEVELPHETGHIHSNIFSLIVGDGGQEVRLWRWNGTEFDGPRALCEHRSSAHTQHVHVHPRFNAAGTQVVFTSDRSGYGNVYLVDVPDFDTLPPL